MTPKTWSRCASSRFTMASSRSVFESASCWTRSARSVMRSDLNWLSLSPLSVRSMNWSSPSSGRMSWAPSSHPQAASPPGRRDALQCLAFSSDFASNHCLSASCWFAVRSYLRANSPVICSIRCFSPRIRIRSKSGERSRISGWLARKMSSGLTGLSVADVLGDVARAIGEGPPRLVAAGPRIGLQRGDPVVGLFQLHLHLARPALPASPSHRSCFAETRWPPRRRPPGR